MSEHQPPKEYITTEENICKVCVMCKRDGYQNECYIIARLRSRPHPAPEGRAYRNGYFDGLGDLMKAIENRFEDTNRGKGVVGTIRGLVDTLRQQAGEP